MQKYIHFFQSIFISIDMQPFASKGIPYYQQMTINTILLYIRDSKISLSENILEKRENRQGLRNHFLSIELEDRSSTLENILSLTPTSNSLMQKYTHFFQSTFISIDMQPFASKGIPAYYQKMTINTILLYIRDSKISTRQDISHVKLKFYL